MHELTKDLEFRLYFSDMVSSDGFQWLAEVRQVSTGLWVAHGWGDAPQRQLPSVGSRWLNGKTPMEKARGGHNERTKND